MQNNYFICMRIFLFALLCLCMNSFAAFVAVLETISIDSAITPSECHFLTDELRAQAGAALPPAMNYTIMTRENINVMLPPGKALEDCEGTCLAETGRNIAADYIAQARVGKFGDKLTLTVELYETGSAKLLGSYTALQSTAVDLWNDIKRNSKSLFARVQDLTRNLGGYSAENNSKSGWDASPFDPASKKKNQPQKPKKPSRPNYIIDHRDGEQYKIVMIGKKVWMAENLRFRMQDAQCYDNREANCPLYGRYYTWAQALKIDANCNSKVCRLLLSEGNIRGVCPEGWHIPTNAEWKHLVTYVNYKAKKRAAQVLKSTFGWNNGNGTNESGFNAVASGYRFMSGNFMNAGRLARYWTASQENDVQANSWQIEEGKTGFVQLDDYKSNELPVRCVEDD